MKKEALTFEELEIIIEALGRYSEQEARTQRGRTNSVIAESLKARFQDLQDTLQTVVSTLPVKF